MRVLHVGCGSSPLPNLWPHAEEIRLDLDPESKPDILGGMDNIPLPDNSVDAIYTSHTLEHVFQHEAVIALGEFLRVLKPDGYAMVIVPDIQAVAQRIIDDEVYAPVYMAGDIPVSAMDMFYGHQALAEAGERGKEYKFAHKFGYTPKTLGYALQIAGFRNVRAKSDGFNAIAVGLK